MLTGRPARRAVGGLLVLTAAGAGPVLATGQPALADSVRSAQQWVLDAVDAPAAWPVTQGSGVLVAVIDSGVRPDVSDLTGSVTSGPDLSGVGTPASDAHWGMHGTWMASLIAGHGHGPGGSDGISGVAPQAKILSIRVLPDKKDPGYSQYKHESSSRGQHALAQAIRYAVAHHANVISMSLGYGASSRVVRAALQDATRHGVVVVASSGNSGTSASGDGKAHAPYMFPADYPGVLGVAAVDRSGGPASFSSDNLSVQIAAPGVKVPAQGSDGQYWLVSGTSPACALTAGVAALIKSVYPHLAPALVIRAITVSAQNQPKLGYDDRVGFGTLDAAVALTTAGKLTGVGVTGRGVGVHSHFGGGPKAIPPAPIGPRGSGQLMLFGGLAVACLIVSLIAAGRLMLYRRRVTAAQAAPPPGPPYPGASPPALAYPTVQPGSAQPGSAQPGSASQVQRSQVQANRAQAGLRRPIRPPSRQRARPHPGGARTTGPGRRAGPRRAGTSRTGRWLARSRPGPSRTQSRCRRSRLSRRRTWPAPGGARATGPGRRARRRRLTGTRRTGPWSARCRRGRSRPGLSCPRPSRPWPSRPWPSSPSLSRPGLSRIRARHCRPRSRRPRGPARRGARGRPLRRLPRLPSRPAVRRRHGRASSGRDQPERDDPGLADLGPTARPARAGSLAR